MPKLYHHAGSWQLPGQQDKHAERVDVPNPPAELAAWLNARRVPVQGDAFDGIVPGNAAARELLENVREAQLSSAPDQPRNWQLGPPTNEPPRVAPRFLGDRESSAEFVPVTKAAEIDRLLERCPQCHRSEFAALAVRVRELPLEELQHLAEVIREHVGELTQQLEERTVQ